MLKKITPSLSCDLPPERLRNPAWLKKPMAAWQGAGMCCDHCQKIAEMIL